MIILRKCYQKSYNIFVDGRGYAGRIDEITLRKLTIKTEDWWHPISIDMGMEKLEAEFTFAEYDTVDSLGL